VFWEENGQIFIHIIPHCVPSSDDVKIVSNYSKNTKRIEKKTARTFDM
jgi:hypothetical protein